MVIKQIPSIKFQYSIFSLFVFIVFGLRIWFGSGQGLGLKIGDRVKIITTINEIYLTKRFEPKIRYKNIEILFPSDADINVGEKIEVVGKMGQRGIAVEKYKMLTDAGILQKIRTKTIERFGKWLPAREAGLSAGILLGGSGLFLRETVNWFRGSGMSHIIAASGYNVIVVSGMISIIGKLVFGRRKMVPFVLISIFIYLILAGLTPPVVRAGIMASIGVVGKFFGRKGNVYWTLFLTTTGMLIFDPNLTLDIGFQLSVLATAAMLWGGNLAGEGIVGLIVTTFVVMIFSFPVLWWTFGTISLVALISNPLVLPVVPVAMFLSGIAATGGWIWEPIGQLFAIICWPLLRYITFISGFFASLPGSILVLPKPTLILTLIYILTAIFLLKFIKIKLGQTASK